jgi:hypothetical protein
MSTFGNNLNAHDLKEFLKHIFKRNKSLDFNGKQTTPVIIWGTHGLGKTEIVKEFTKENNWKFAYCAPAQFEEMGDLHGMPMIKIDEKDKQSKTVYSPPQWVPTEEGPGILLIDDVNRADDRILRGLMQLFQDFELQSWKLPKNWQIVATANPDDGNYSVTPMDDALLTRLLHVTLKFDVKIWAQWAVSEGVDSRAIDFVLTYPEVITGKRTTPRSLVHFFNQISDIEDLKSNLNLVISLAKSALDDVTVSTFISFVNQDLVYLLSPSEILDSIDFNDIKFKIKTLAFDKKGMHRVDRISTICSRLYFYLKSENYKNEIDHKENLVQFLLLDEIPNDLKMSLYIDLNSCESQIKDLIIDKRLSKLLISIM